MGFWPKLIWTWLNILGPYTCNQDGFHATRVCGLESVENTADTGLFFQGMHPSNKRPTNIWSYAVLLIVMWIQVRARGTIMFLEGGWGWRTIFFFSGSSFLLTIFFCVCVCVSVCFFVCKLFNWDFCIWKRIFSEFFILPPPPPPFTFEKKKKKKWPVSKELRSYWVVFYFTKEQITELFTRLESHQVSSSSSSSSLLITSGEAKDIHQ